MPWVATDDFESYTLNADLNGTGGGSGWTGNWTKLFGTDTFTAASAPGGGQAARAIGPAEYQRNIANVTTGVVTWRTRLNLTNPNNDAALRLCEGTSTRAAVTHGPTGNLEVFDGAVTTAIQAYSANTWYTVTLELLNSTSYRVKIDGGSWTTATIFGGSFSVIDNVHLDQSASTGGIFFWIDDIGPGAAAAAAVISRPIYVT